MPGIPVHIYAVEITRRLRGQAALREASLRLRPVAISVFLKGNFWRREHKNTSCLANARGRRSIVTSWWRRRCGGSGGGGGGGGGGGDPLSWGGERGERTRAESTARERSSPGALPLPLGLSTATALADLFADLLELAFRFLRADRDGLVLLIESSSSNCRADSPGYLNLRLLMK
ncbi:hypothetical protein NL676_035522 [Syzygium grande]|nr:hypothetical protein NL676_035522 [Syzygium grande]